MGSGCSSADDDDDVLAAVFDRFFGGVSSLQFGGEFS
jgi:hypothetical protein